MSEYDASMTEEEMVVNLPVKRVYPSLTQVIRTKEVILISKYVDLHCMGTKNLPRFIHEDKGAQPSLAEIYIDNRTRGNGSIVTEKSSNVINELKKLMVEAPVQKVLENLVSFLQTQFLRDQEINDIIQVVDQEI
ncbi:hypothetical protein HKD37_05G012295 [Glycine soja]